MKLYVKAAQSDCPACQRAREALGGFGDPNGPFCGDVANGINAISLRCACAEQALAAAEKRQIEAGHIYQQVMNERDAARQSVAAQVQTTLDVKKERDQAVTRAELAENKIPQWISVKDKMPTKEGKYMAVGYRTNAIDETDQQWETCVWFLDGEWKICPPDEHMVVTHYLRYPTPPYDQISIPELMHG